MTLPGMPEVGGSKYDEEDFNDFMSKVDSIDAAVKGLKEGTLSVEDVDKKYGDLLQEEEGKPTKRQQKDEERREQIKEEMRRKELKKLPKTIETAERQLELAKETQDINKVKLAEANLFKLKDKKKKEKEYAE